MLTAKQTKFAHYIAEGVLPSEAYRRSYETNSSKKVVSVRAAELKRHEAVAGLIKELQDEVRAVKLMERVDKRRMLARTICDPDEDTRVRLEAVKIDNAMTGDNAPVKVEGEITLGSILREIAPTTGLPSQDAKRSRSS